MPIFYKYLSFIDEKTFKNPTVRLSVPMHLNDPFESSICNTITDKIKTDYDVLNGSDIKKDIFHKIIREQVNRYGIVSLSETSRNLLMWAHYADEHRGICIGYKEDFLDSMEKIIEPELKGHFKPTRVMYDTTRYYNDGDKALPNPADLCFKILTNKSDDWIYEKEHRCIVPLFWSDYIKFIGDIPFDLQLSINRAQRSGVNIRIENDNEYYITSADDNELRADFSHYKNAIFIKKIDPSKIEKIYFGCRYPTDKLLDALHEVSNPNHCLHHVKFYQYELDTIRFELKEIPIDTNNGK